jgi:hypothetical protein
MRARRSALAVAVGLALFVTMTGRAFAGGPPTLVVPTLDGAGLLALGGALSVTGAWWIARRRDKGD